MNASVHSNSNGDFEGGCIRILHDGDVGEVRVRHRQVEAEGFTECFCHVHVDTRDWIRFRAAGGGVSVLGFTTTGMERYHAAQLLISTRRVKISTANSCRDWGRFEELCYVGSKSPLVTWVRLTGPEYSALCRQLSMILGSRGAEYEQNRQDLLLETARRLCDE